MRTTLLALLIPLLSALSAADSALPESLYAVPRSAPVSTGETIMLGEVITIVGCRPEWTKKLNDTPIARAAQPGQSRILSRLELTAALRKAQFTGSVDIAGNEELTIIAASQLIAGKKFVDAASSAIQEKFAHRADVELKFETVLAPPDLEIRPGPIEFQTEFSPNGPQPGTQSMRVRLLQDSQRIADCLVTLKLRLIAPVAVAVGPIHAGDVFTESNIVLSPLEVPSNAAVFPPNLKALIGQRARTDIAAGQPLLGAMAAAIPAIRRGESVIVHMKSGGLEISARGESRNDAARGDVVRIVLPQSDGEVPARVIGSHEARIGD